MIYKCKVRIVPYVVTWDGVVTSYHKKYLRELGVSEAIRGLCSIRRIKEAFRKPIFGPKDEAKKIAVWMQQ